MTINLGPSSTGDVQSFFQLGGFNLAICSSEDDDLCQRFAFWSGFANSAATIACLYGRQSWNKSTNYLRVSGSTTFSRENVLAEPRCFFVIIDSSNSDDGYGRVCRVYGSTVS
jgi:hypothetical protein